MKGGYYSYPPKPVHEPTEAQIAIVKRLAQQYGVPMPEKFTRKAYTQFISNHSGTKEGHRRAKHGRTDDDI